MSCFVKEVEVEIEVSAQDWYDEATPMDKEKMAELLSVETDQGPGLHIPHVGNFRLPENAYEELLWRDFLEGNKFLKPPKPW